MTASLLLVKQCNMHYWVISPCIVMTAMVALVILTKKISLLHNIIISQGEALVKKLQTKS